MDDALAEFIGGLSPDQLNSTAIFIMSDHGLHMGEGVLLAQLNLHEVLRI
jgi:hypothetical protein